MVWLDADTYLNSYKKKGKTLKKSGLSPLFKNELSWSKRMKGYFIVLAIKSN